MASEVQDANTMFHYASTKTTAVADSASPRKSCWRAGRQGTATVEAAIALSFLLLLMLGVWQVGQLVQTSRTVSDAAREGARVAAGGITNGTSVTVSVVQQTVQNYLTAAGFPAAAVNGAQVSVVNLSGHSLDRSLQRATSGPVLGERHHPCRARSTACD